jgi:O-antigen ligase
MLSIDHYQTYLTARKTLALTLLLAMLLGHTSTMSRFRWLVRTVVAVGLGSAVFAILRLFLQAPDAPAGFVLTFLVYGTGYGQFISANPFAYLMEMSLGLVSGLVLGGGMVKGRSLIYIAILAVLWTALVLSNSRGGILSLACESIFVLYFALDWYSERKLARGDDLNQAMRFIRNSRFIRVAAIVLVLAILSAGVLWMGGDNLANKIAGRPQASHELSGGATRQEIWSASWKLFKHHPWTGTGLGAYFLGIPQFQESSGRVRLEQAHNDYLDLAASGGIVGLILGAWFVAAIVRSAKSNIGNRDPYRRAATLGAATGLIGVAAHSFVDFGLQLTGIAVVCSAMVAILAADFRSDRTRRRALSTARIDRGG